jgi:hypothetical protein
VEESVLALDQQEVIAAEQCRARRPALNFAEMGIPIGSLLSFTKSDAVVEVSGPKMVRLEGIEMSLTAATRQLLGASVQRSSRTVLDFGGQNDSRSIRSDVSARTVKPAALLEHIGRGSPLRPSQLPDAA